MIRAGILGGSGYTGVELLRLLAGHPRAEVVGITSRAHAGVAVAEVFPSLRGVVDLEFSAPADSKEEGVGDLAGCDVVFCAAPNGVAMGYAQGLLDAGVKVVDLSADFRLRGEGGKVWEAWYGGGGRHACAGLLGEAVYGLPEVNRARIKGARLVANPGCYPTAVLLGYLPLVEEGLVRLDSLVADAKSGVSGAGRKAELGTAFAEVSDSFKAYGVAGHRHQAEIVQELEGVAGVGATVGLTFTPHLVPMIRGLHATLYARVAEGVDADGYDWQGLYERRFAGEAFVDVLAAGGHPETRSVRGSNVCRMAVHRPLGGDVLVVLVVEDNLVKGAAGQAIQNMNLMFGLPEGCGLDAVACMP